MLIIFRIRTLVGKHWLFQTRNPSPAQDDKYFNQNWIRIPQDRFGFNWISIEFFGIFSFTYIFPTFLPDSKIKNFDQKSVCVWIIYLCGKFREVQKFFIHLKFNRLGWVIDGISLWDPVSSRCLFGWRIVPLIGGLMRRLPCCVFGLLSGPTDNKIHTYIYSLLKWTRMSASIPDR